MRILLAIILSVIIASPCFACSTFDHAVERRDYWSAKLAATPVGDTNYNIYKKLYSYWSDKVSEMTAAAIKGVSDEQ